MRKQVTSYDNNWIKVETYDSVKQAADKFNVDESSIRKAIKREHKCGGFRWKYGDYDKVTTLGDISAFDDEPNYAFDGKKYSWKTKDEQFELPLEVADKLFFEFSVHGLNLSSMDVMMRNNLSPRQWHSSKNRLRLYKHSDIFSPESRASLTDKQYREVAKQKIQELDAYKKKAVVEEYNKYHLQEAKKWRDIANRKTFVLDYIVQELNEWLPTLKEVTMVTSKEKGNIPSVAAIADIHLGARIENIYNTPQYDTSIITNKLVPAMTSKINSFNPSDVDLIIDGDIIETFTGMNHPNSWQQIGIGEFGSQIVKTSIEVIEKMISQISNLRRIIFVAGNHDRITSSNKEDINGQVADIIAYVVRRLYNGKIKVEFDPYLWQGNINDVHYIITHGYDRSASKTETLVNDYAGERDMFNLVLSADKHTRNILGDGWNYRHVKIPPFFTGNAYSTRLGFSSTSGMLMIKSDNGLPEITDCSFYSKLHV